MKADRQKITRLLRTARGQMDGVLRMIDEDRYCLDISAQLMAIEAVMKKANREVLRAHLDSCVREALTSGDRDEKLQEIMQLIDKLTR